MAKRTENQELRELQQRLASLLGKRGGASKSEAKAAASRENGKLGGRPRKNQ